VSVKQHLMEGEEILIVIIVNQYRRVAERGGNTPVNSYNTHYQSLHHEELGVGGNGPAIS